MNTTLNNYLNKSKIDNTSISSVEVYLSLSKGLLGIFPICKPKGPTSHDIIYRVRRLTGVKRVGHGGTLDPLASGVLVVAVGREFTKQLATIVGQEKEYLAEITLGVTSTTDDEEGEKEILVKTHNYVSLPTLDDIRKAVNNFIGEIWQVPPKFSAIKIKGKTAYTLARQGKEFKLEPRLREVKEIEVVEYAWPKLKLRVVTGKGVYIRSLARDIGEALGVGGYMSDLVRTRVGEYRIEDCYHISDEH